MPASDLRLSHGAILLRFAAVLTLMLNLVGCAVQDQNDGSPTPQSAFGIPFPDDRQAAELSDLTLNGADALYRSAWGATEVGTSLSLQSSASGMTWAVYRFTPAPPFTVASVEVTFSVADEAWIGLADYTTQHWGLFRAYSAPQLITVDGAKHISPNGNIYIAVLCASNHHAQIDTLTLTINTPPWAIATPKPDGTGGASSDTSLAVINGRPAISYHDSANDDLKFVRATDAEGSAWGTPQTLDSEGSVGRYISLKVINGFPAVSYYDKTNQDLKFVRATDEDGGAWGTPQTLDIGAGGDVGSYTSLAVVNGFPAISYYVATNGTLRYIRAGDPDGTSWGTSQVLDSTGIVGLFTSLAVVNGFPAISYFDSDNADLKFVKATDPDGGVWGTPQTIDSAGFVGEFTSLAVVDGFPAISYFDRDNADLKFVRATDPDGGGWDPPQTLDSTGDVGRHSSLAVVNGFPAISYIDRDNDELKYILASQADGSAWGAPQTLAYATSGSSSLAAVNGQPAISYYDYTNGGLQYIRLY